MANYFSQYLEDVLSSATPPANPNKDQLWWRSSDNTLHIWSGTEWILGRSVLSDDPSKAPLDSPHFTGQPTTPHADPGTNNGQIASTHFVMAALEADTVDWLQLTGKPATFPPTLPISQSDVTGLVSALNLKAPILNPIFTGNPKSVTPPPGDVSQSIATTAFVDFAIENSRSSGTVSQYWRGDLSWQVLDKIAVGLNNVDNTSDIAKPVSTAQAAADNLRVLKTGDTMSGALGIAPPTGAATLSLTGAIAQNAGIIVSKTSAGQIVFLESRVGANPRWQVAFGDSSAELASPTNSDGSDFVVKRYRNDGVFLGDSIKILRGDGVVGMPSGSSTLTQAVGNNSTLVATTAFVATALTAKENLIVAGTTIQYWRGDKTWQTLNAAAIGLGNVDNTSDSSKPISTATQTALNLKAPLNSPQFTGKVATTAAGAGGAGFTLPHGSVPPTPLNGDLWSTSAGFFGYANGVIVGPFGGIGPAGPTGPAGPAGAAGPAGPSGTQVMYIGDGPPSSPVVGQTWFESDTGNMYVYYNDGNSTQWVSAHVGVLPDGSGGTSGAPDEVVGGIITISTTAPSTPAVNDIWIDIT